MQVWENIREGRGFKDVRVHRGYEGGTTGGPGSSLSAIARKESKGNREKKSLRALERKKPLGAMKRQRL